MLVKTQFYDLFCFCTLSAYGKLNADVRRTLPPILIIYERRRFTVTKAMKFNNIIHFVFSRLH